jgi:hypothetical protein
MHLTDVTGMTRAVFEAFLDAKSGAEFVDCGHLTVAERAQLAKALGWPDDARTRAWVANSSQEHPPRIQGGIDYEARILEEQEDDGQNI